MNTQRLQVFYSFHFDNDVFRVQQIRNIGVIEGNEPVSVNDWETLRKTSSGIERWIDNNMKYKSHVVVLIGSETVQRPWVNYEIKKGWNEGKRLLGIYIHNLRDPREANTPPYYGRCAQGLNPFGIVKLQDESTLDLYVPCFTPNPQDAHGDISKNLLKWLAQGVKRSF